MRSCRLPRPGIVLLAILACLLVVAALAASLTHLALSERAQVRKQVTRVQAEWLADAGVERAAYLLSRNGQSEEQWQIPANHLGAAKAASVQIVIEAIADDPGSYSVVARAEIVAAGAQKTTATKQVVAYLPNLVGIKNND